jgi:Ca2+-binding RTX toxin-like protein
MPLAAAAAAAAVSRRRNQSLVRAFGPVIESLEPRRLLAAAALVDGVITWTGGPEANKLVAVMKAKTVAVRTDGVTVEFPLGKVKGLLADGGEGDDLILIDQTKFKFLLRTTMFGGAGNDSIVGGNGRDVIRGGLGLDTIVANSGDDNVDGNEEADSVSGGGGHDKLTGADGDDSLLGGGGDDRIFAGAGNDYARGDDGADAIDAGDGDDRVTGGSQPDVIAGGLGADSLSGSGGDDAIDGGDGDDKLQGEKGNDSINGGAGIDSIYGNSLKSIEGGGTDDGWGGALEDNDAIDGGDDADAIYAGGGDDLVRGGGGDDVILGGFGWDDLSGGDGSDTIHGEAGEDFLFGQLGMDLLYGGDDADQVDGGADDDAMSGGGGGDLLFGGEGNDSLAGEAGDDHLDGEGGADWLAGGAGADTFAGVGPEDLTDKNQTDPGGQANLAPSLASVSSSANPVLVGDPLTLTANGVTDLDGVVIAVRFYRESNGVTGLQTGLDGDTLIATDANAAGGWNAVVQTSGTKPGEYEYHAQATDNGLFTSDAASTIVTAEMPLNVRPTIAALVATPTPVEIGSVLTLIAQSVTDANGSIRSVAFYEETNGVAGLQIGGDKLLGAGTRIGTDWSRTVTTTGRQAGTYSFYAVATDNGYSSSTAASTVATVVLPANKAPKIGALTPSVSTLIAGATLTLSATSVSDPDGTVVSVSFYYESNGVPGLQAGAGGDAFIAADITAGTVWSAAFSTAGWAAGDYRFYAHATDDDGEVGAATATVATIEPYYIVDVTVDDADAALVGTWTGGSSAAGYYGAGYVHDGNELPGTKSATFSTRLSQASNYDVFARWPADPSHASNARVEVVDSAGVTHTVAVNQRERGGEWVLLGTYHFGTSADAVVRFRNDGADGFVIADAVRFATANRPPKVGSLSDDPSSVSPGQTLALFASAVSDPDGTIAAVSFYRESNGIAGLQTGGGGGDAWIGSDALRENNVYMIWHVVPGLAGGTYTYYAQATDDEGAVGNAASQSSIVLAP